MRSLHACTFVAISALAACGGGGSDKPDAPIVIVDAAPDAPPDAAEPDAQEFDFSCENDAPATAGTNPIVISGTANDINIGTMMPEPVAGATLKAFKNGIPAALDTATSANDGTWSLSLANPTMMPLDGFVDGQAQDKRPVLVYPPNPLSADFPNVPVLLLANDTFDLLVSLVLSDTQDPNKGTVGLVVLDCAGTPIGGATISVKQNNADVGKQHDLSAQAPGTFLVLDVPEGDTVVGATFDTHTLHAHTVTSQKGTTTTTVVTPRP
jgi:hypothetical protein